jgi:hypothetical protein
MSNGVIIYLDNDRTKLDECKNLFVQLGIDLQLLTCQNKTEFQHLVEENRGSLKCLIFDLLGDQPEDSSTSFLDNIKANFAAYNIPVFIYSGFLIDLEDQFVNNGTVFKVDKNLHGFDFIFEKIKLFHESGFLNVFSSGGILESQINADLHKAFITQFKNNDDLEKIILSIQGSTAASEFPKRTERIIKRIAVKSLLSELLSPEIDAEGKVKDETLSSTEHYVHRINNIPIWTGDLFMKKSDGTYIFILTPRCNVMRNEMILYCPFTLGELPKKDKVEKMLAGDPLVCGYERFIPPSPIFLGGKLLISKFAMLPKTDILTNFERTISLSEELTNEILGKFGAYFFRSGITPWDPTEIKALIPSQAK